MMIKATQIPSVVDKNRRKRYLSTQYKIRPYLFYPLTPTSRHHPVDIQTEFSIPTCSRLQISLRVAPVIRQSRSTRFSDTRPNPRPSHKLLRPHESLDLPRVVQLWPFYDSREPKNVFHPRKNHPCSPPCKSHSHRSCSHPTRIPDVHGTTGFRPRKTDQPNETHTCQSVECMLCSHTWLSKLQ